MGGDFSPPIAGLLPGGLRPRRDRSLRAPGGPLSSLLCLIISNGGSACKRALERLLGRGGSLLAKFILGVEGLAAPPFGHPEPIDREEDPSGQGEVVGEQGENKPDGSEDGQDKEARELRAHVWGLGLADEEFKVVVSKFFVFRHTLKFDVSGQQGLPFSAAVFAAICSKDPMRGDGGPNGEIPFTCCQRDKANGEWEANVERVENLFCCVEIHCGFFRRKVWDSNPRPARSERQLSRLFR